MFNFSKKSKEEEMVNIDISSYYVFGHYLYKVSYDESIDINDEHLNNVDIFNKYGCYASKISLDTRDLSGEFMYYNSLKDFIDTFEQTDSNLLIEVSEDNLDIAIQECIDEFKKKFYDFKLDDTIYTQHTYELYDQCFKTIAKVKRKLVDENTPVITRSLILEIEIIDGKSANSRCEFIYFYDFLETFSPGHKLKVIDNFEPYPFTIDCYF